MDFKDSKELARALSEREASLGFVGKSLLFILFPVIISLVFIFLFCAFLYIWLTIPFTNIKVKSEKPKENSTTLEV